MNTLEVLELLRAKGWLELGFRLTPWQLADAVTILSVLCAYLDEPTPVTGAVVVRGSGERENHALTIYPVGQRPSESFRQQLAPSPESSPPESQPLAPTTESFRQNPAPTQSFQETRNSIDDAPSESFRKAPGVFWDKDYLAKPWRMTFQYTDAILGKQIIREYYTESEFETAAARYQYLKATHS